MCRTMQFVWLYRGTCAEHDGTGTGSGYPFSLQVFDLYVGKQNS